MAATTVGALLILGVVVFMFWAIKTTPERRERSLTPLQDAYAPSDDEGSGSADAADADLSHAERSA